jgi:N6-adenosine-specific RNA methylase IME4
VVREAANIRLAPTNTATVERVAPKGMVLQVYGRSRDGWVQVGDDVPLGWIYASRLGPAS